MSVTAEQVLNKVFSDFTKKKIEFKPEVKKQITQKLAEFKLNTKGGKLSSATVLKITAKHLKDNVTTCEIGFTDKELEQIDEFVVRYSNETGYDLNNIRYVIDKNLRNILTIKEVFLNVDLDLEKIDIKTTISYEKFYSSLSKTANKLNTLQTDMLFCQYPYEFKKNPPTQKVLMLEIARFKQVIGKGEDKRLVVNIEDLKMRDRTHNRLKMLTEINQSYFSNFCKYKPHIGYKLLGVKTPLLFTYYGIIRTDNNTFVMKRMSDETFTAFADKVLKAYKNLYSDGNKIKYLLENMVFADNHRLKL